jgi:hypothetical protein
MKYFKVLGLCLVAAFVVSAVAVATASATKPGFRFSGTAKAFSSKSGAGTLVSKAGHKVKCTSDRDTGEIEGASETDKVTNVIVIFLGCKAEVDGVEVECKSTGANKEEIRSNTLEGQLGYVPPAANKKVGLVLKSKVELFAEFKCLTTTVKVRGREISAGVFAGIVGEFASGSVNTLISPPNSFVLNYKQNAANKWEQEPRELEVLGTTVKELLLEANFGAGYELSGLETTDEIFPLQSTEISA